MRLNPILAVMLSLSAVQFLTGWSSCEPPSLTTDPSFDLWCGNELCSWQTDVGQIRRVPTWNQNDFGVELVSGPARISQLVNTRVPCLRFQLLADIDPGVTVTLKMDFQDDNAFEYSQPISGVDWSPMEYSITAPTWYENVRFILEKTGEGRAVMAHLRVTQGSTCTTEPLVMNNRPDGAGCDNSEQCLHGRCIVTPIPGGISDNIWWLASYHCGNCHETADCQPGMICGLQLTAPTRSFLGCQLAQQKVLGERCMIDEECITGFCCHEACSQCCNALDCPAQAACATTDDTSLDLYRLEYKPWQCSPGSYFGAQDAPCLFHSDCTSRVCKGDTQLKLCQDGRRCENDEDCPPDFWGEATPCQAVGVDGGVCF